MFCDMPLMPFSKHVHTTHWEGGNMIKKLKGCGSIRRKGLWYFFLQFREHIITKKKLLKYQKMFQLYQEFQKIVL